MFQIFPNPANQSVITKGVVVEKVVVYNILGQEKNIIKHQNIFDVSDYEKGCYFLEITDVFGALFHAKLLIN